jgi:TonB family protein
MKPAAKLANSTAPPSVASLSAPALTIELEPRWKVFTQNFLDLLRPPRSTDLRLSSAPGDFWPDVFVLSRTPWGKLLQSAAVHCFFILLIWGASRVWPVRTGLVQPTFTAADVLAPSGSSYLPPLDTRRSRGRHHITGDPVRAQQPILSVPTEPDNSHQTIVTPPDIKLKQDVPLPNIVAWSHTPVPVPLVATSRKASEMKVPSLAAEVVAPPPAINRDLSRRSASLTQEVVAPPPTLDAPSTRKMGDLNIGHADVVAPAPQLPLSEQRTLAAAQQKLGTSGATAVPPPPSTQGVGSAAGGRIIALGIHPDPAAPPTAAGNRRGSFEVSPDGKNGGSGAPNITGDDTGNAGGGSNAGTSGVPPGLFVGKAPANASTVAVAGGDGGSRGNGGGGGAGASSASPPLIASVTSPRVSSVPHKAAAPVLDERATDLDKQVFGGRKFYSMALNMPNLNSAGGSWVVRFAELKDADTTGELLAPVATQKVDPEYPLELMRRNVEGTVALYAVIHSDGHVSDVKVLRGVDERLDGYAMAALSRWHFEPAIKNGNPVALETVVMIPFKTGKKF